MIQEVNNPASLLAHILYVRAQVQHIHQIWSRTFLRLIDLQNALEELSMTNGVEMRAFLVLLGKLPSETPVIIVKCKIAYFPGNS